MAQTPTRSVGVPPDTALLVEGHVSVRVPAHWAVERITSGPGSARVRITQPGGGAALHITQSTAAAPVTLAEAAETLRRAIESTPAGVFVDFRPDDHIGGRPAVTYRERRTDAETSWTVVVDGATRIAVGCQYPADHPDAVRAACEQAVRSARAVR
jgi:type VII secretion-associated protein (TIGR03931 family)